MYHALSPRGVVGYWHTSGGVHVLAWGQAVSAMQTGKRVHGAFSHLQVQTDAGRID